MQLEHPPIPSRKHSKLGIVSLGIAIGFPFLLVVLFVISILLEGRIEHRLVQKLDTTLGLIAIIGGPLAHFAGLVLAIAGAFQKDRKRLFAIIGIVLNGTLVLIAAIFTILFLSLIVASLGAVH